mgnify:CR=1 FL=1
MRIIVSIFLVTLATQVVADTIECKYSKMCSTDTGCAEVANGGFALSFSESSVESVEGPCLNRDWVNKQNFVSDNRILLTCNSKEGPGSLTRYKVNRNSGEFEQSIWYSSGGYVSMFGYCTAAKKKF